MKFKTKTRLIILSTLAIALFLSSKEKTLATNLLITQEDIIETGIFNNLKKVDSGNGIKLEASSTWGAFTWKTPDKTLGIGSAFASDGEYIYVIRGFGDNLFWRYNPNDDSWKELKNMPRGTYYGSDLQFLDGHIYALFGGYQKGFARYSIEDNVWESLEEYPDLTYTGTSLTSDGTDIYGITGNNTQSFFKYTIDTNSWTPLPGPPANLRAGADLVYLNGYIYTPRGSNTRTFYRYEISTNSWVTLADTPLQLNDDVDITTDGQNIYITRNQNFTDFFRYNIDHDNPSNPGSWDTLASTPLTCRYAGVQYLESNGYIYVFRGNSDTRFWKYSIEDDEFIGPRNAPQTLSTGSDIFYHNDSLYTIRGANQRTIFRYDITQNTWYEDLNDSPTRFNDDTRGFLVGDNIYLFRGSNTTDFLRYDINGNNWTNLASTPLNVRFGGGIAYPGSGDLIYATRGANTTNFWSYNIVTDTWDSTLSDLPSEASISYGSGLVANSTHVFATTGIGQKRMYKYEIDTDTWEQISDLPFSPFYGTDLAYDGDNKILAIAGEFQKDVWEYTISTDTWRRLKDIQGFGALDLGPYRGGSIVYTNNGNYFVTRGNANWDMLLFNLPDNNYEDSGYWVSQQYDLLYVNNWVGVTVEKITEGDSEVLIQTRSSSDGLIWSEWQNVVGGNITSPANRYLQVRTFLYPSSDNSFSPFLESINISYVTDTNPPNTPSNFIAYSREIEGEILDSEIEHNYTNPFFTWDLAIDDETDIYGYYVYWGDDEIASPVEEGSFQTTTNYRVNQPIEAGANYLIVVSEDLLGNRSEPIVGFEYNYNGIAPSLSLSVSTEEFNGETDSINIEDVGIRLEKNGEGFWLEEWITPPPFNFHYGSKNIAYVESSNKLYVPRGSNTEFYEYDITNDQWTQLANAPARIYYGGGAVEGPDGYIYVATGDNQTDFWRYSIADDTWDTEITNAPLTIGYGASLLYDGFEYIYVIRGHNNENFWRYNTLYDEWETLESTDFGAPSFNINNRVYRGGSAAIDLEN